MLLGKGLLITVPCLQPQRSANMQSIEPGEMSNMLLLRSLKKMTLKMELAAAVMMQVRMIALWTLQEVKLIIPVYHTIYEEIET